MHSWGGAESAERTIALTRARRHSRTHARSLTRTHAPGAQVATFLLLASGMPTLLNDSSLDKSRFDTNFRLRFGRDVLKWIVLILLPSFLVCALGLVSYEVYYELSTTGGKGKRFKKLVASLRLAGERRTLADVKTIYETIVETDFLRPYPYTKLVKICRECELRELKPQETLFSEGDVGVHFFVLIKGTVDVYVGGKGCINSHHNQGSFGELALLQVM